MAADIQRNELSFRWRRHQSSLAIISSASVQVKSYFGLNSVKKRQKEAGWMVPARRVLARVQCNCSETIACQRGALRSFTWFRQSCRQAAIRPSL